MHSALDEVLHGKKSAKHIRETWETEKARFPKNSLHMRFSDNHDERRAIARFGEGGALAAQALVFTIDGVPMLYNGMEAGDTTESGAPALFEKLPIFWQFAERRPAFSSFYRGMIDLRNTHIALRRGETVWVDNNSSESVLSFVRKHSHEEILVIINLSNRPNAYFRLHRDTQLKPDRRFLEEITPKIKKEDDKRTEAVLEFGDIPLAAFEFRIFKLTDSDPRIPLPKLKRREDN